MFYTFSQNNSGGFFIGPEYLIVEADDAEQANEIAQDHGVYFDGRGDCECCGPRWSRAFGPGDEVPSIWGEELTPQHQAWAKTEVIRK